MRREMTLIKRLVAWCKEERRQMQESLERMESGADQFGPLAPGTGFVDTTASDIERYRRKIAELDALIARHPDVGTVHAGAGTKAAGLPRVERDQAKLEGVPFVRLGVWEKSPS